MLVGEVVAGQPGEDVQDARGGGRGAGAVFGVERELFYPFGFHCLPDVAFDECVDQHGDEVAAQ